MPATIVNGNILRVTIVCSQTNQVSLNRMHYIASGVAGTPTDLQVATAADTAFAAAMKAIIPLTATYRGCMCQIVSPNVPMFVTQSSNANAGTGGFGTTPMPAQVCGLITWLSVFAGRTGHGRFYAPFPAIGAATSGETPSAGYVTNLGTLAAAINGFTTVAGGGNSVTLQQCNWNQLHGFQHAFTGYVVRPRWATQKRRGDYGRANVSPI
jgi:hypothetical protein